MSGRRKEVPAKAASSPRTRSSSVGWPQDSCTWSAAWVASRRRGGRGGGGGGGGGAGAAVRGGWGGRGAGRWLVGGGGGGGVGDAVSSRRHGGVAPLRPDGTFWNCVTRSLRRRWLTLQE